MPAYSADELARIEEERGSIYRRRTEALVDLRQRHLTEWSR